MALSGVTVDWPTGVITVPRAGMTLVQTVPSEIREMNLNEFHLALKDLEDDPEGIPFLKTHNHNTEVLLGGIIYARIIEILDPYTITFENGFYAVNLVGANSNVGDLVNINNVSVRSNNSAGLISSPDIEFASFNGGVMINTGAIGFAGTTFPTGTERKKSNNISDTILIAQVRGFKKIYADSDLTLGADAQLDEYSIVGNSHVITHLQLNPDAALQNTIIWDCEVNGTLDGAIKASYEGSFNGAVTATPVA